MKKKNYNKRTCLISKNQYHKNELIRICIVYDKLVIDIKQNLPGRGYYLSLKLKYDPLIIKKKLEKQTKIMVDNNLLNELAQLLHP